VFGIELGVLSIEYAVQLCSTWDEMTIDDLRLEADLGRRCAKSYHCPFLFGFSMPMRSGTSF